MIFGELDENIRDYVGPTLKEKTVFVIISPFFVGFREVVVFCLYFSRFPQLKTLGLGYTQHYVAVFPTLYTNTNKYLYIYI